MREVVGDKNGGEEGREEREGHGNVLRIARWWLILGGVFFVDATVTLARRYLRGDKLHEAHRSHAYQWLARRWGGHKPVTLAVTGVNLVWLLPCAWLALHRPEAGWWLTVSALCPLVLLAIVAGAGRAETASS